MNTQIFFLRKALGGVTRSRVLGVAALAVLGAASAPFTMIVGIAASTAVLVAVSIADAARVRSNAWAKR